MFHKKVRKHRKERDTGGVVQQVNRELAEREARLAALTGDKYTELMAEGTRYASQHDTRRAAKAYRAAIALRPDKPSAYFNLGAALTNSGHYVEAAQWYLEAKERSLASSEDWAQATSLAFNMLVQKECAEVAKPEWWNDEGLQALSARVVTAAPNRVTTNHMRAVILSGLSGAWKARPPSSADLAEAAAHYERAAALCTSPVQKADLAARAYACRLAVAHGTQ